MTQQIFLSPVGSFALKNYWRCQRAFVSLCITFHILSQKKLLFFINLPSFLYFIRAIFMVWTQNVSPKPQVPRRRAHGRWVDHGTLYALVSLAAECAVGRWGWPEMVGHCGNDLKGCISLPGSFSQCLLPGLHDINIFPSWKTLPPHTSCLGTGCQYLKTWSKIISSFNLYFVQLPRRDEYSYDLNRYDIAGSWKHLRSSDSTLRIIALKFGTRLKITYRNVLFECVMFFWLWPCLVDLSCVDTKGQLWEDEGKVGG